MPCEISIIVPVYKVEPYLKKCINSILAQTFKDFELILVNDGSPDCCGEICDDFALSDRRIKVIHKENGGLSSARNAGLKIAQGKFIAFVDSDDLIHFKMYEILHSYALKYSSEIVMCDYLEVSEGEGINSKEPTIRYKEEHYTNIEALNELYGENGVKFVVVWNKLYKRSLFDNLAFEEDRIHEDEFIAHKLLYRSSKVTYLPIQLHFYLQRINSITQSSFNIKHLDFIKAYKERVDFFESIKQFDLQKKAEYCYIPLFFRYYYKAKNEVPNSNKELKKLKSEFCLSLFSFINNPYFIKKEKIGWFIFMVNSNLFDNLVQKRLSNPL
ncbi:glycosyltransferase [Bacillus sp. AFS088145]|uniref:glycosyltransferase family 2 protein n=1 Tax=Bacillus sp. AFS088145 TaxID=2033514 RepID=UPI000BF7EB4A|nr:glycosyltransferase [Bacillus sp. AFS088145]PFH85602.1 glycosyl transferase [Bacillus sp. AFS088145]